MNHIIRRLGLALLAVFAISATAASSASATTDLFTSSVASPGTTFLTGESTNEVIEITGAGVQWQCAKAKISGSIVSGASSITVTPTYSGTLAEPSSAHCGTNGLGSLTFTMNGCKYILTGETTGSDNGTDATIWLECPLTGPPNNTVRDEITLDNELCTIHIHEQTPTSGGVTYSSSSGDIVVTTTMTGITYSSTGAFCALGGISSEGNNMLMTGTATVKGFKNAAHTEAASISTS